MNYKLSEKKDNEIIITFTITEKEWAADVEEAYQKNKGKYKVEGFRAGKVPRAIIEKMYGKEIFFEDAFNDAFPKYYTNMMKKEKELYPIDYPEISVSEMSEKGVVFTAKIVVLPEFKVEKYTGFKVEKEAVKVKKAEVTHELEHMREHHARFVEVTDRAVKDGDLINLNYSGAIDGVKFDGGTAEDQELTIGSGMFIPCFEEQMVGMNIGEEKDIVVKFPENYGASNLAGKDATFTVKVLGIREKELPKLDDEFAKEVSEFNSLAELQKSIEDKIKEQKEKEAEAKAENKLIDTIMDGVSLELPKQMVDKQVDYYVEDLNNRLMQQGLTLDGYFNYMGTTEEAFRKDRRKDAEKSVKASLVLEEIVKLEKIKVKDKEYSNKVTEIAAMYGQKAEDFAKIIEKQGAENSIRQEILTEKVMKLLKEKNEIV